MKEKEIAEIRRRFRPDRSNVTRVRGCCVNNKKEIISEFSAPLGIMAQEEAGELLAILKKTLSGTPGKNLLDIEFSTQQVIESGEHKLLMALRDSALNDEEAVHEFYNRAIGALDTESSYLILLAYDTYDVPYYAKDGKKQDASSAVFSYFLCSVCPIKLTKQALGYHIQENEFRNITPDWAVSAPELGFMFPAFDDRAANIYNALYYSHNTDESHDGFVDAIFKTDLPMPAGEQKETFTSALSEAVAEDCSYRVVQAVHGELSAVIEEHKESKGDEPPAVSKGDVEGILRSCGVPDERISAFGEQYEKSFGTAKVSPQNVIDPKKLEIRTPDVVIKVNPERGDLVETRVIDGVKYILIRADGGAEVNGVGISIT
ncbi:MAG TPA: hypothetical protein DIV41_03800 [Ruminococcaceae bacterium]|nr:hypothetical protein [Oscillospiraceae bacterium]